MALIDINDRRIDVQYNKDEAFCSVRCCNVVNIPFYGCGNPVEHNYPGDTMVIYIPCNYFYPNSEFTTKTDLVSEESFTAITPFSFHGGMNEEISGLPVRVTNAEVSCRLRCITSSYLDPVFWKQDVTGNLYNTLRGTTTSLRDVPFIDHVDVTFVKMRSQDSNTNSINDALQNHGEIVGDICILNRKVKSTKLEDIILNGDEAIRIYMSINYNQFLMSMAEDTRNYYNLTHTLDDMDISLLKWRIDFRISGKFELINFYNEEYDDVNNRYEISEEETQLPEEVPLEENE